MLQLKKPKGLSNLTIDELCGSLEANEKRMGRFSTNLLNKHFNLKKKLLTIKIQKKEQENKDNSSSQQRNLTGGGRGKQNFRG